MTDTIYSDAIKVLDKFGWVRGQYGHPRMGYCLYGALDKTVLLRPDVLALWDWEAERKRGYAAFTAIRDHLGRHPVVWNDEPGRTKQDVVNLLQEMHEKELAERGELG